MALSEVNITPLPLPLSTTKHLISRVYRSAWDNMLYDALHITSMGQYRRDFSPQLSIRKQFRDLDVDLTRPRLGNTTLSHSRLTCTTCVSPLTHTAPGAGTSRRLSNTSYYSVCVTTLTVLYSALNSLP